MLLDFHNTIDRYFVPGRRQPFSIQFPNNRPTLLPDIISCIKRFVIAAEENPGGRTCIVLCSHINKSQANESWLRDCITNSCEDTGEVSSGIIPGAQEVASFADARLYVKQTIRSLDVLRHRCWLSYPIQTCTHIALPTNLRPLVRTAVSFWSSSYVQAMHLCCHNLVGRIVPRAGGPSKRDRLCVRHLGLRGAGGPTSMHY